MLFSLLEEVASLVSVTLFVGTIAVWSEVLTRL